MKAKTYIISKGRATRQKTRKQLIEIGVPHTTVVEQEDFDSYRKELDGNYLILNKSNQGVAYARNACVLDAIKSGTDIFSIIDDDLSIEKSPAYYQDGRFIKRKSSHATRDELYSLYNWFWNSTFSGLTLGFEQFSHRLEVDALLCGIICCFTLFKTEHIAAKNLQYDLTLRVKEDVDFSVRMLKAGLKTIQLNTFTIMAPPLGSHKGGCYEQYRKGKGLAESIKVYERHREPYIKLRKTRFLGLSASINRSYFREKFCLPSDAEYCQTHAIVGCECFRMEAER